MIRLFMEISDPSPQFIKSVQGAFEGFEQNKLNNVKREYFANSDSLKDRKKVYDENTCMLLYLFYDPETELQFVSGRGAIK